MGTKDTTEGEPKEYDEDEAESNEDTQENEVEEDQMGIIKEKEVITRETITKLKAKGKIVVIEDTITQKRYCVENAYFHAFYDMENEIFFYKYYARGFIMERNIDLDSFKCIGVLKVLKDREWMFTTTEISGFVPNMVYEFFANISENIDDFESLKYHKVYVRGHVYELSPRAISNYLKIPIMSLMSSRSTMSWIMLHLNCWAREHLGL